MRKDSPSYHKINLSRAKYLVSIQLDAALLLITSEGDTDSRSGTFT